SRATSRSTSRASESSPPNSGAQPVMSNSKASGCSASSRPTIGAYRRHQRASFISALRSAKGSSAGAGVVLEAASPSFLGARSRRDARCRAQFGNRRHKTRRIVEFQNHRLVAGSPPAANQFHPPPPRRSFGGQRTHREPHVA